MTPKEGSHEADMLLNKYKEVHIVDLMDEINEKFLALFLKIADMSNDEIDENAVIITLDKFLSEITVQILKAKKGVAFLRGHQIIHVKEVNSLEGHS